MAGSMSLADLVADLKASLNDAAEVFVAANDGDFSRHLDLAALDFARVRPRTLVGELLLVADQADYAAPADFHGFKCHLWGEKGRGVKPWEKAWPGQLPRVYAGEIGGALKLYLDPTPTAHQIALLGTGFKYFYFARHAIAADAADTTIREGDRGLLILRAQAEAMKELAARNVGKPVSMRDGITNGPRNGTPAALYQGLMDLFERAAA